MRSKKCKQKFIKWKSNCVCSESLKEIPHRRSLAPKAPTHSEPPPISIKDAVETIPLTVPIFDRTKTSRPVFQFIRACERARSMMPGQHESHLIKLLMNKLKDYAFLEVEDISVTTVNETN